jgi:[citrate (pro-3S)-lyase] ligase
MSGSAVLLATSREIAQAQHLIRAQGLLFETSFDELVGIYEGDRLVATAARDGFVLKMFVIDPAHQGGEALGALVTELVQRGRTAGHEAFFVYTRPENASSFEQCNFRLLVTDGSVALLEYGAGLQAYLDGYARLCRPGANGAVVINGNPFTLGHLYLVETAAREVGTLYLFIVREDRSVFPFAVRYRLAAEATSHIANVILLDTSRYAVSAGTFPSYFLKSADAVARSQMRIDLRLFGRHLAPAFFVTRRFVGHEPYCAMTAKYNETMAEVLPEYGIELVEVPRKQDREGFISATKVRDALARRDFAAIAPVVPAATLEFLRSEEGLAIAARLAQQATENH